MNAERAEKIESFVNEIEDIFSKLSEVQQLYEDYTPRHIFEFEIDSFRPVLVIFNSDIHFGSIFTDYQGLKEFWKELIKNNRVFLAVVGDFIDNFDLASLKHLFLGINSQLITPELQRDLFTKYIRTLAEFRKVIACVLGNHEHFSHQYPFFSFLKNSVPVASNRMLLRLRVGFENYKIALVHRSRYNSSFNPVHSNWRELTLIYPDADVIVTAHTHNPMLAVYPYPYEGVLLERLFIKTGTFKKDPYQTSNFNTPNFDFAAPAVVFYPFERKMVPFLNYRDAIRFMTLAS